MGDESQGQGVARSAIPSAAFCVNAILSGKRPHSPGPPGFLLPAHMAQLCPQRERNFLLNSNQKTPRKDSDWPQAGGGAL